MFQPFQKIKATHLFLLRPFLEEYFVIIQKRVQISNSSHLFKLFIKFGALQNFVYRMEEPPMSKRKLKKLKRDQEWEATREQRKVRRKEKIQEKKARKRAVQGDGNAAAAGSLITNPSDNARGGTQSVNNIHNPPKAKQKTTHPIQLPITIILDCGFDKLMTEKECKSLSAQITRCYSDNHKAPFKAHLAISSFGGLLKERFDNVLSGHYSSWKGVRFLEEDFWEAAQQAEDWMKDRSHGGKLLGALGPHKESPNRPPSSTKGQDQEAEVEAGELVYLTSDSPHTLTELKPYSTYIIGGIVDRNRHKGICYKRAMDRGVKTAKLPIGDYMQMSSRFVLATNHVSEIMLRWMEIGDWGKAFLRVIPKRKGGTLKGPKGGPTEGEEEGGIGTESPNEDEDHGENDDDDGDGAVEHEEKEERDEENMTDDKLEKNESGAEIEDAYQHKIHESTKTGVELEAESLEEDMISAKQVNEHQESPKGK